VYKERQFAVVLACVTAFFQWIGPESSRSAIRVETVAVTGRLSSATSDRLWVGVAVGCLATLRAVVGVLDPYC
jgi:hypothetical protein